MDYVEIASTEEQTDRLILVTVQRKKESNKGYYYKNILLTNVGIGSQI